MSTRQPVKTLQEMLGQISADFPQLPPVIADGCFGERTLEAVMIFQRDSGLPVTGTMDRETWHAMDARCKAAPLRRTHASKDTPDLILYRLMFHALSQVLSGFLPCEVNSPTFAQNLRLVQRLSGLSITGRPSEDTWNNLFRIFRLFYLRNRPK